MFAEDVVDTDLDGGSGFFQQPDNSQDAFQDLAGDGLIPATKNRPLSTKIPSDQGSSVNQPERKKVMKRKKVPKIYFGTRTHKQISQIIRELKKTTYRDTKMTILASRDHTCIHPTVSKMKNRTEGCKELIDRRQNGFQGQGCMFQTNVKAKMATHHAVNAYRGTNDAWDVEDLVTVGKKIKACPYFASRELKVRSDIIFCPYNYLIEPLIRKSMEIAVKGQIIILDEAHNIEDSAREGASWDVTQEDILEAMQDLEKIAGTGIGEPQAHREMAKICSTLSNWMDQHVNNLTDYNDYNSQSKIWSGTEIVAEYQLCCLGPENYPSLKKSLEKVASQWSIKSEEDEAANLSGETQDSNVTPKIHSKTMNIMEGFLTVLHYLYMKDMKHRDDFRVALTKAQSRKQWTPNRASRGAKHQKGTMSSWLSKTAIGNDEHSNNTLLDTTISVSFWCLNPAVCFEDIKDQARSIVLTSGTLSPMASFSSELDVKFPIQLEANHVIDKKQIWIGTISHGPNNVCLKATYQNTESFSFQDEIGLLTAGVCDKVPHGVLLFLTSYRMLTKLSDRWKQTGVWDRITRRKVIITEPRFSDEFDSAMRHFYEVIESTNIAKQGEDCGVNGALFLAVCRGKVSEGLDFADNNARAVICLGIPFPNWKDPKVELKMKYNDKKRGSDEGIIKGQQWYEIQAFRALNQALGRCIRHRNDWGAILMVDERYVKNQKYVNNLSKWVRSDVIHHSNYNQMMLKLEPFVREMIALDEVNAHINEMETNSSVQEFLYSNSGNQTSNSSTRKGTVGNWVSKKGNQHIQYESDSFGESSNPLGNETYPSATSKLNMQLSKQNKKKLPELGSFNGPKNCSEFFSKSEKNKRAPRKTQAKRKPRSTLDREIQANAEKQEKDKHSGPKGDEDRGQSPAARLARFMVQQEDIIKIDPYSSRYNTKEMLKPMEQNYTYETPKPLPLKDTSSIPSDIKIGTDIPSNSKLTPVSTSHNSNSFFHAPLSDITTKNTLFLNNLQPTKKKFKFSPVSESLNSLQSSEDPSESVIQANANTGMAKSINISQTGSNLSSANHVVQQNFLRRDSSELSLGNYSSSSDIKTNEHKISNILKSTRYIPGKYSNTCTEDSDEDFQ